MKITEETKIKDILPEGYEVVRTHQNIESIVIEMKRKPKDFGQYAMAYQDNAVVITLTEYLRKRNVDDWPWEFRIGLLKYICDDLDVSWANTISFLNHKYVNHLEGLNSSSFQDVSDICPEEFLKSLV